MRRRGRICALQILYQLDLARQLGAKQKKLSPAQIERAMQAYWASFDPVGAEDESFAERLVHGVANHVAALDEALSGVSHHWSITRMGKVDRNLLRQSAFEILFCPDVPAAVTINEAIEIAKLFSSSDAASFMNGMLDQLAKSELALPKNDVQAAAAS